MILRAKHHPLLYPFFIRYGNHLIRRHFGGVTVENRFEENHKSLLLLMNHFSWWDGFFASYLNDREFHREFYFMMLEEQLRKYWFFRLTGGYSIRKGNRTILESLDYTITLLQRPRTLVLLFPQGKIESQHQHMIKFQKGIGYILSRLPSTVQVLFGVVFVDYFSSKRPNVFIYVTPFEPRDFTVGEVESSYQDFFRSCLQKQYQRIEG